ncbi:hypothetical protein H8356DRAFT_1038373 [Neocallimastix lanati (nom. inval.)]|nr:hypothetical protein H8356DRAFT_1038373 [Neocallimastix sp. JGI-2020a]
MNDQKNYETIVFEVEKELEKPKSKHYPITISPDVIWILFLQGYSRFMEKYSELVRSEYVNFQDQKELVVKELNKQVMEWNEADWRDIINNFVQQIKENVGETIVSHLQSNFSTTNSITLTASLVSIMSGLKKYFKYIGVGGGCGISFIHLEGSLEDWMKVKSKLVFLSKKEMALGWWIKHLIPLIDKIIMTKRYYHQNKEINEEIREFWKNMVRVKIGKEYNPDVIDGWIIKFIPNLTESTPKLYDAIKIDDIPDQIIECPITLINYNNDNKTKTVYKSSLASGFFGMDLDEKTFAVKPLKIEADMNKKDSYGRKALFYILF